MAEKHYLNEVKEFINTAELRYKFEAGRRRLTALNGMQFLESIQHCSSAEHQSLCAEKLSNEKSPSNYDIQRAVDYLLQHSQQEREVMKSNDDSDLNDEVHMAAQVGLILLKRNSELEKTNESLEKKLVQANEEMTQLKHELQLKLSLLRALAEEEEDQIINDSYYGLSYQDLQAKMKNLEEQNQKLQLEISHLKDIVASSVDREELLTVRYRKQRSDSQSKIQNLCEQLNEGKQVCMLQQTFLENFHKEIEELNSLNSKLREENAELSQQLQSVQAMFTSVKAELQKMEGRYDALWCTLVEAESETKTLVANSDIELSGIHCGSAYVSLAAELMNHCERNKKRQSKSPVSFQSNTSTKKLMKKALKWQLAMDSPTSVKLRVPVSPMLIRSPPSRSSSFTEMPSSLMMIESTTPPPVSKESSKPLMMIESTSPPQSSSLGQSPWQSPVPLEMVDETDPKDCSELDPPSSESVSSRCPTPEYGVPGVPGTKDLVRAIRRLKLKALQRSLSKQTTNPDEEIAASADADHPVEVEESGGLLGRIQRWLTCSLMPSYGKTLPQWSAACFVNTTGTYSFVNSQVLHPQVDSRLYNLPGLSSASKLAFGSYPLISAPSIVSSYRCCSCGQEVNSFDLVNNANTKRGTVVINGGDSSCLWTAESGSATNCTWVRHMVVLPVFTKLCTDDANQNTGNKAE
ncbi:Trafficking kinesin-binding protein 1 [Trichinella patagoniensis]|uniref:Trafficking kinesin-binding protein 1 n=1 Tax=Trichinella patagoniensis TaxID=990121 RepID=A0A0V0ZHE9_9BILA|nr:Trafficking kinesin-binding protein 1 [Trichinella patagoniensis]